MMTDTEFKRLAAEGYNRIPLIAQAFADLETPLSLYLKLTAPESADLCLGRPNSFLLESVVGGERFGRYSFIGLPARTVLRATGFVTEVVTDGVVVERHDGNPLDFIAAYQQRFKVALQPGLPRFCGGLATSATTQCAASSPSWLAPHCLGGWERRTSCCCSVKSWRSSTTSRGVCR